MDHHQRTIQETTMDHQEVTKIILPDQEKEQTEYSKLDYGYVKVRLCKMP